MTDWSIIGATLVDRCHATLDVVERAVEVAEGSTP
jgi:hypothetical protein